MNDSVFYIPGLKQQLGNITVNEESGQTSFEHFPKTTEASSAVNDICIT